MRSSSTGMKSTYRAGFHGVGHQARIGRDHEIRADAKLPGELVGEIDGDAARPAIRIPDREENRQRRRVNDAGPKLAGGSELFHCHSLAVGPVGKACAGEERRGKHHCARFEGLHGRLPPLPRHASECLTGFVLRQPFMRVRRRRQRCKRSRCWRGRWGPITPDNCYTNPL